MWAEPLHTGLAWGGGGVFPALMKPGKPEHLKGIQIQEAMTSLSFG